MFKEDTGFSGRDVEHHAIPELPDVTPIPNATVSSGPDAEAFPQELTNYTEEVSSQRIPPMVYISGGNPRSQPVRVTQDDKTSENSRNLLNCGTEAEQTGEQGPLSRRYMEPSVQAVMTTNSPTLQEYWDKDYLCHHLCQESTTQNCRRFMMNQCHYVLEEHTSGIKCRTHTHI